MRQDFSIYNESNMFTLHSDTYAGVPRAELFERGEEVQEKGHAILVELPGDSGVCLRVVVDEALTEAEETEWIARQQWHLHVPNGKLGLEGGLDARNTDEYAIDEGYLTYVDIPPGHYQVTMYTYLSSYYGLVEFQSMREEDPEPLGAYFRRTHPGKSLEDMPDWMQILIAEDPDADPGFEDEWDDFADSDAYEELLDRFEESDPPFIEFLAHFTRIENETAFEPDADWLEERDFFGRKEVWMKTTVRRPEICPAGIRSQF